MSTTSIDFLRENIRRIQQRRTRLLCLQEISVAVAVMTTLFAVLGVLEKVEFLFFGRFLVLDEFLVKRNFG